MNNLPDFKLSIQWMLYPLVMLLGVVAYFNLNFLYAGEIWISYIPIITAALFITTMEYLTPHNLSWKPNRKEIKIDMVYMVFIQVAIPFLLALSIVSFFHEPLSNLGNQLSSLWPHHWSLIAQSGLMLLIAEFLSYWLHRISHAVPFLWKFHAVHHSPEKLYWLNVGRFHPLEKIFQYMVSTFPFMLLGVSKDVIGLYFVFYGINGFFQHSNIKLNYGILNYIVSSANLHRWHHSPIISESNNNFGNNLIIWDLLFGTWFLPSNREITTVGSGIAQYPQTFLKQMIKPFKITNASQFFKSISFKIVMLYFKLRYWQPFIAKSKNPDYSQRRVLNDIIKKNRKTKFGIQHDFSLIKNEKLFKEKVKISQYEDIEYLLKEQESTGDSILYRGNALFYARTSGTTGNPKDIPITKEALNLFKHQQRLLTYYQYKISPEAFYGKALGIVGPAIEGTINSDSKISFGSVSGYLYNAMPDFVKNRYLIPAEVFTIADYDMKYRVIIRLALIEESITYIGTANPSTFLRIRELINEEWDFFLSSMESGYFPGIESLPVAVKTLLISKIKPEPTRLESLKKIDVKEGIELKNIWPTIRMITTWTCGNCQIAFQRLKKTLPEGIKVIELGYVASEFRGTITFDQTTNAGLPMLGQVYYEFIEKDDWDNGIRETLTISELDKSKFYYIIITTDYGLYRYFMNDLVEVCNFYKKTPLLKFVQKGKGVTSITGEKLYEAQLSEAIEKSCRNLELEVKFHLSLANVVNVTYEIYLELNDLNFNDCIQLSRLIDNYISNINIEYAEKRKSKRLNLPQIYLLKSETAEAYKRYQIDLGQREGQYKIVTLLYKSEFGFPLKNYISNE